MNIFNTMSKSSRQEVLSASPLLVLYHDLLTEGEMHLMKDKVVHRSIFEQIWKKEFLMSHQSAKRLPQVSSQMNPATVQDLTNNAGKVANRPIWQVCIFFWKYQILIPHSCTISNWVVPFNHNSRLEICQKIYTTRFFGQKFYTLKVRKLDDFY